jgi:hypothetical protein
LSLGFIGRHKSAALAGTSFVTAYLGYNRGGNMILKKVLYVLLGFALGFFVASAFFIPELQAQWENGAFNEGTMRPSVPAKYGKLVAVSGIIMYFQAENGNVYIVKPRTDTELDPAVTLIKRS